MYGECFESELRVDLEWTGSGLGVDWGWTGVYLESYASVGKQKTPKI